MAFLDCFFDVLLLKSLLDDLKIISAFFRARQTDIFTSLNCLEEGIWKSDSVYKIFSSSY